MGDEFVAQLLRMGIYIAAELSQDGEPHIFRTDDEVMMLVVGLDGALDEAIGGSIESGMCGLVVEVGVERSLEKLFTIDARSLTARGVQESFCVCHRLTMARAQEIGFMRSCLDCDAI